MRRGRDAAERTRAAARDRRDGVLTIESRGDGASRMAVWSAYQSTPTGVRNLTVLFGADAATFARLESLAHAIFRSARFD